MVPVHRRAGRPRVPRPTQQHRGRRVGGVGEERRHRRILYTRPPPTAPTAPTSSAQDIHTRKRTRHGATAAGGHQHVSIGRPHDPPRPHRRADARASQCGREGAADLPPHGCSAPAAAAGLRGGHPPRQRRAPSRGLPPASPTPTPSPRPRPSPSRRLPSAAATTPPAAHPPAVPPHGAPRRGTPPPTPTHPAPDLTSWHKAAATRRRRPWWRPADRAAHPRPLAVGEVAGGRLPRRARP